MAGKTDSEIFFDAPAVGIGATGRLTRTVAATR